MDDVYRKRTSAMTRNLKHRAIQKAVVQYIVEKSSADTRQVKKEVKYKSPAWVAHVRSRCPHWFSKR